MKVPKVEFEVSPAVHGAVAELFADRALPGLLEQMVRATCLAAAEVLRGTAPPLVDLDEVEVSVITDEEIGRVHGEFLDDPTPTDVITFDHGEILIGAETAVRQAKQHGCPLLEEIARYCVHGVLHLAGYEDGSDEDRAQMMTVQETILARVFPLRNEAGRGGEA